VQCKSSGSRDEGMDVRRGRGREVAGCESKVAVWAAKLARDILWVTHGTAGATHSVRRESKAGSSTLAPGGWRTGQMQLRLQNHGSWLLVCRGIDCMGSCPFVVHVAYRREVTSARGVILWAG
jgi:hypothetical protein